MKKKILLISIFDSFHFYFTLCMKFIDLEFNLQQVFNIWLGIKSFVTLNPSITISDTIPYLSKFLFSLFFAFKIKNMRRMLISFQQHFVGSVWTDDGFFPHSDYLFLIYIKFHFFCPGKFFLCVVFFR